MTEYLENEEPIERASMWEFLILLIPIPLFFTLGLYYRIKDRRGN